jgi:hypothetical protein
MKSTRYVCLLFLAFSLVASASPEPNLSGTWVLNQINGNAAPGAYPVLITHKGNEFVVNYDRRSPMMKQEYFTDGTERRLPQIVTPTLTYYTAKWDENSLVIDKESDRTLPPDGRTFAIHTREVWSISADGKNLTRLMTIGAKHDTPFTLVYQKVDNQ